MLKSQFIFSFKKNEKFLLFNALSNSFIEVNEQIYNIFNDDTEIFSKKKISYLTNEEIIYFKKMKFIFQNKNEIEDSLNQLKLERIQDQYLSNILALTIAPTMRCNFKCLYCFEDNKDQSNMTSLTEDKIIEFIKGYKNINHIFINWFGGEPLLNFQGMISITEKISNLKKNISASITTNGYLLSSDIVEKLEFLKIKDIQITIDGTKDIHDKRRPHLLNLPTFDIIINNIENIIRTEKKIKIIIRINLDKSNSENYFEISKFLSEKFANNVHFYPAMVSDKTNCHTSNCNFNKLEWVEFMINAFYKNNYKNISYLPKLGNNICSAGQLNGYVIDSEGYLYKCWAEIGDTTKAFANLHQHGSVNPVILSRYLVGCNPFEDETCKKCCYLPICGGGCIYDRLESKYNNNSINHCLVHKHKLEDLLWIYYQIQQKQEENTGK